MTPQYARDRHAFGRPIGGFQVNRFALAEMKTRLDIAHAYLDRCVQAAVDGELTADEAAGAKWWATELQWEIVDRCLQLHGGYGYINEYEIARLWRDARVQRLYGGTTEIMKEIVGRGLGFLQCLLTGEEQRCNRSHRPLPAWCSRDHSADPGETALYHASETTSVTIPGRTSRTPPTASTWRPPSTCRTTRPSRTGRPRSSWRYTPAAATAYRADGARARDLAVTLAKAADFAQAL